LTRPKHTPETIEKFGDVLVAGKAKSLLPEVVEIEFFRKIDMELSTIKKGVDDFIKNIGKIPPAFLNMDNEKFIRPLKEFVKAIEQATGLARREIDKLFKGKNVIKIPVSTEIFRAAYLRALRGRKPSKFAICGQASSGREGKSSFLCCRLWLQPYWSIGICPE